MILTCDECGNLGPGEKYKCQCCNDIHELCYDCLDPELVEEQ